MAHPHVAYFKEKHSSRFRLLISALFLLIQRIETCQVVHAAVGSDAVLPCEGEATNDKLYLLVRWTRAGLPPAQHVYYRWNGQESEDDKHVSYKGRTSLFLDEVKNGNVSLKISRVQFSDAGTYKCYVPDFERIFTVQLIVEPSQVVRAAVGSDAVLPCEVDATTTQLDVEWTKAGLPSGQYVYYQRNGREFDDNKDPSYKGRTSLFMENGIVSLKLSPVQESDTGIYKCYVPESFTVKLIVERTVYAEFGDDVVLPAGQKEKKEEP